MRISVHYLRQVALAFSLFTYLALMADTFLLPLHSKPASIKTYTIRYQNEVFKIFQATLLNGEKLQIKSPLSGQLYDRQDCIVHYSSLFEKAIKISVPQRKNNIKTFDSGMLNTQPFFACFFTIIAVLASILFFTNWMKKYDGSNFGPFAIALFNIIFFLIYYSQY